MSRTQVAGIIVVAVVLLALFLFISGYGSTFVRN